MLQIKSKFKIGKRLGPAVFEKCQTQKFTLSEARGRKAVRGRRSLSDFGKQMLEKQKVRFTYGLTEKQFRNYIDKAIELTNSPEAIHIALETRLDSVAYRAGLAPTRRAARQMVSHGHITVNGKRMTTPSHHMRTGDVFAVRVGSADKVLFAAAEEHPSTPAWLAFDWNSRSGSVLSVPRYAATETSFDYPTVFEFYSR
ncbi:MAG: 30S ribosomal protein S4 [Patescibacteria group bacterium]